jgi:sulfopyruvate decarboxylase alpha subunit
MMTEPDAATWPDEIFAALKAESIQQVAYVPDAGHARLIERCAAEASMETVSLTTEEEGVALLAGAWLGGARGVLLMQSSGVGNCINMFSLVRTCRFPLLMLVTMRGEAGEFNPWQVPMGGITPELLRLTEMDVRILDRADAAGPLAGAAARDAFSGGAAVAILISQSLVGVKTFDSAPRETKP